MITIEQYLGKYAIDVNWNESSKKNANQLLKQVNALIDYCASKGILIPINPATGSQVSGQTDGGFRGSTSVTGATFSAHREGKAVDAYDPKEALDDYITKNPEILVKFNLYREHPSATSVWCHLTTRAPKSRRRTFFP